MIEGGRVHSFDFSLVLHFLAEAQDNFSTAYRHILKFQYAQFLNLCQFFLCVFICCFAFPLSRNLCLQIQVYTKQRQLYSTVHLSVQSIHMTGLHSIHPYSFTLWPSHRSSFRELTLKKQVSVWLKGALTGLWNSTCTVPVTEQLLL